MTATFSGQENSDIPYAKAGLFLCHGTEAQGFVRQMWILADLEWSTGWGDSFSPAVPEVWEVNGGRSWVCGRDVEELLQLGMSHRSAKPEGPGFQ